MVVLQTVAFLTVIYSRSTGYPIECSPEVQNPQINADFQASTRKQRIKLEWLSDGWKKESVVDTHLMFQAITDSRWNYFPIQNIKLKHLNKSSVAFSVYTSTKTSAHIFINDQSEDEAREEIIVPAPNQWTHYSIISKSNKVLIYENHYLIAEIDNFEAGEIHLRSEDTLLLKTHDYTFRSSNKVSPDLPSVLRIPPASYRYRCFKLFAAICQDCLLEVSQESAKLHNNFSICPTDDNNSLVKKWHEYRIEVEPYQENILKIWRKHFDPSQEHGSWAMALEPCEEETSEEASLTRSDIVPPFYSKANSASTYFPLHSKTIYFFIISILFIKN